MMETGGGDHGRSVGQKVGGRVESLQMELDS